MAHSTNGEDDAYAIAATWYDFNSEYRLNAHVILPGKPLFSPRSQHFDWHKVTYAINECKICSSINRNRPEGKPRLPCLRFYRFNRCVYYVATDNKPNRPPPTSRERCFPQKEYPQMRKWEYDPWSIRQRAQSFAHIDSHARSSSNDYPFRRYSEHRSDNNEAYRTYDQANGHERKRRRSSRRGGTRNRESSPVRKDVGQSCIPGPSNATLHEFPTQNDPPSSPTEGDLEANQASVNVDALFLENNSNTFETDGDNEEQGAVSEVAQAASPNAADSRKRGSFSTSATTPPPLKPNIDDDGLSDLRNAFEKVASDRLKQKTEKEELEGLADQLQERYNRKSKDVERLEEENEKLKRQNEKLNDQIQNINTLLTQIADRKASVEHETIDGRI